MSSPSPEPLTVPQRAAQLYAEHTRRIAIRTDRLFAALLTAEWIAGIVIAVIVSPRTWAGTEWGVHLHLLAAVGLGGAIIVVPVLFGLLLPGSILTRHLIAIGQMLMGGLLIHLTGGRIETHFYVFGALAFLAFYRDWKVLLTATVVTALDHFLRGIWFPQSIYGVLGGAEWRWVEHAWWVLFEDAFLMVSCMQGQAEMRQIAKERADLEENARQLELHEEMRRLAARNEQLAVEAMAATRAKSEFLAAMSHELRTPMNAIINYADLGIRRGGKALAAGSVDLPALQQQVKFVTEIRTAGDRLLSVINQLLDLSRIEAGRMEVHVEDATASEIVERVRKIVDPLVQQNGNRLDVAADSEIKFHTDVQKLEQCLINLVGNAAKFTHRGSIVLEVVRGVRPETAVLVVSDTGIGMSEEQVGRLFTPFNQADSSITRQYGGSGLGLAITRSMVTLIGGTVAVESEPNQGSRFTVTVPMHFQPAAQPTETPVTQQRIVGRTS